MVVTKTNRKMGWKFAIRCFPFDDLRLLFFSLPMTILVVSQWRFFLTWLQRKTQVVRSYFSRGPLFITSSPEKKQFFCLWHHIHHWVRSSSQEDRRIQCLRLFSNICQYLEFNSACWSLGLSSCELGASTVFPGKIKPVQSETVIQDTIELISSDNLFRAVSYSDDVITAVAYQEQCLPLCCWEVAEQQQPAKGILKWPQQRCFILLGRAPRSICHLCLIVTRRCHQCYTWMGPVVGWWWFRVVLKEYQMSYGLILNATFNWNHLLSGFSTRTRLVGLTHYNPRVFIVYWHWDFFCKRNGTEDQRD